MKLHSNLIFHVFSTVGHVNLKSIFEILFGLKPEHLNKITIPNSSRNK